MDVFIAAGLGLVTCIGMGGGGVLNCGLAMGKQLKGPKIGACRTDLHQTWVLAELIPFSFLNKIAAFL